MPRTRPTEPPDGDRSNDPPDAADGGYADYVERLEAQIAGRTTREERSEPAPEAG